MEMCPFLYLHTFEVCQICLGSLAGRIVSPDVCAWLKRHSEVLLRFTCADHVALQKQAREQHTICNFI